MADNQRQDDFPTIRLDEEDRQAYQKSKQPSSSKPGPSTAPASSKSGGGNGVWVTLVALIALAGVGGCYYLYTQLEQQKLAAQEAENRIMLLEKKLSATGEEIGESTVALQVKVNELVAKTEELWEQMDKLWASAWRRNQKEIADLGERVTNVQSAINGNIQNVADDVKATNGQVASLKRQLATVADDLLALNVQLEQAQSDKQQNAQTVKSLNDKLSVLEQRNNALSGRISKMEQDLRDIATKMVSSSPTASVPVSRPVPASGAATGQ
ncbi:hypothetical protein [Alteromonas sp. CYL-A6]|uniref:hypothetical protein n=1 Tax=Alteromonas nitratireducens TaxID=3390813 RepID=UPI0034A71EE3